MFVRVQQGRYGITRKLGQNEYTTDANKDRTRASKTILVGPEYKAIKDLDVEIYRFVRNNTLPSTLDRGMHVVMNDNAEAFDKAMCEFSERRKPLVRAFVDAFERLISRDMVELGTTFNQQDYGTPEQVMNSFAFGWSFVSLDVPQSLQALSEDMYNRAKEGMEANYVQAEAVMRDILRAEMQDLVTHLIGRLGTREDGKKAIFRDSMVSNFQEFFDSFKKRNITNDEELSKLVEQAQALLSGVDPESLREQDTVRDRVKSSFEDLKQSLDSMIVVTTNRQINID